MFVPNEYENKKLRTILIAVGCQPEQFQAFIIECFGVPISLHVWRLLIAITPRFNSEAVSYQNNAAHQKKE